MINTISWEQAMHSFQHNNENNIELFKEVFEEIQESDFSYLDARDVHWYAKRLNDLFDRKDEDGKSKPYTANEVRYINMEAQNKNKYDYVASFIDDDTDDFIDFY